MQKDRTFGKFAERSVMPAGCGRTWSGACHLNHQPSQREAHELVTECRGGD